MSGRRPRDAGPQGRRCHLAVVPHAPLRAEGASAVPGIGDTAVWSVPGARNPTRPQIEFASFERLARTAERGLFDFLLLAEGLRLPEHRGRVHDVDVTGRPEPLTVLNALAGVTADLGLVAMVDAAFHEPFDLARRLATLDHLSGGRAGWHVVTSSDALTGGNFRLGACLGPADRHHRAAEFVATASQLWDSWTPDAGPRPFAHRGPHFDIAGEFTLPRSPQGRPVVIRTVDPVNGTGEEGRGQDAPRQDDREAAAATADVVLTRHDTPEAGRARYADLKGRLAGYGREPGELRIMSAITVVLGDTAAEAQERAATIRRRQVSPRHALLALERLWGRDLSAYDPDGPLPGLDPVPEPLTGPPAGGRTRRGEALATVRRLRALSQEKGLSIRQTVIETTARQSFVGTPEAVAADLAELVREEAADGFVLVPQLVPEGLDEFVDRVVPLLQEHGVFRTEYEPGTLRSRLGLPAPVAVQDGAARRPLRPLGPQG
ncbi:NtaA/DmoA family FMN-dependent monooxygenase [Streptomyces asoensis]|uniref:NtaA/DmoA family FMN-dependent monooxygenase n=1 Tax=Streptomyces asoensis TaxID=249586 RepID=UPI0037239306